MDLTPYVAWIVFAHVLGAFMFAAGHGVSMFVVFQARRERDRGRLGALLDEVADRLVYPSEQILTSATDDSERIHRYVEAMFGFFVRSADDWAAFSRDMDHPILREREAHYSAIVARLYAATFGDLAEDRLVAAAARAYVNYAPLDDLRGAGLSLEEAVGVVAGSLAALVRERRTQAQQEANRGQGGGSR
jgi:hypothetical protein